MNDYYSPVYQVTTGRSSFSTPLTHPFIESLFLSLSLCLHRQPSDFGMLRWLLTRYKIRKRSFLLLLLVLSSPRTLTDLCVSEACTSNTMQSQFKFVTFVFLFSLFWLLLLFFFNFFFHSFTEYHTRCLFCLNFFCACQKCGCDASGIEWNMDPIEMPMCLFVKRYAMRQRYNREKRRTENGCQRLTIKSGNYFYSSSYKLFSEHSKDKNVWMERFSSSVSSLFSCSPSLFRTHTHTHTRKVGKIDDDEGKGENCTQKRNRIKKKQQ